MKIIAEKINGSRRRVARAIAERDAGFIRDLAARQAEAGADWLDVNAGTNASREPDDLAWIIETIQHSVDVPLCLDSANPQALSAAMRLVERTPMINSITAQSQRLKEILPVVVERGCPVIALAMDDTGISESSERRLTAARKVMTALRGSGVPDSHVYLDPLAMTLATNTVNARVTLDAMRAMAGEFPEVHMTLGLSNISYGLPARSYINRTFLVLALEAGLECAILDPLDRQLRAMLLSAELVLGRDRHCLNFTRAYRDGMFDEPDAVSAQV